MIAKLDQKHAQQRLPTRASLNESPMLVFYELTQACDLVCQHCRACAQRRSHPFELTTKESKRLIQQLTRFPRPPMLILTGGDPLKRPDVYELIEYATDQGLSVSITPSATPLVTRSAIRRLRDAGVSRMAISIDGSDASTHDSNRGVAGSFARSLEILRDAQDLFLETQVNTTLTPANAHQIDSMADLFDEFDIALWSVFFLVPVGRADALARLNSDDCERAFDQLWHQSQRRSFLIKTTEAPHFRRFAIQHQIAERGASGDRNDHGPKLRPFVPAGINDGKGVMFVGHTGTIHPSGFLPIVCGMFPQQDVVDVYQRSPIFCRLRDANQLRGKCGECEFRQICGGSRARAYAVTGDLMAAEPDCSYIPGQSKGGG